MFESRTKPTFGVASAAGAHTASFRYQLVGWCELIANNVVKARELNNHSDLIDQFLLDALTASSELSCLDKVSLTRLLLCADYILQLSEGAAEEPSANVVAELERQVAEAIADLETPDETLIPELEAQGAGYLPENRLAAIGPERFALIDTIVAQLVGIAGIMERALKLSVGARETLGYEAEGLIKHVATLRPKDRRERGPELKEQAEELKRCVEEWGRKNRETLDGIVDALAAIADPETTEEELYELMVKVGALYATALELHEQGDLRKYGEPSPRGVLITPNRKGYCILYCGDNLDTLSELLDQAEYHGVDVWTNGDAVSAHSYKVLYDRRRLAGHYAGSWRTRQDRLGAFPGGIIIDRTVIDEPDGSYAPYTFSTTPTIWDSIETLPKNEDGTFDMTPAVRAAKDSPGFFRSPDAVKFPIGYGGEHLPMVVDKAARAYRDNALRQIVAVVGQDAPGDENDYFSRLFSDVAEDSFMLACGDVKFRFDVDNLATTSYGLSNLVDLGRERDANALLRFAGDFARELDRSAAEVPIKFFVSLWSEASVALTFALVAQGYRDITVGPNPPECWTPEFIEELRTRFGIKIADEPEADLG